MLEAYPRSQPSYHCMNSTSRKKTTFLPRNKETLFSLIPLSLDFFVLLKTNHRLPTLFQKKTLAQAIVKVDIKKLLQDQLKVALFTQTFKNTKIEPNGSCYITIGGDLRS